MDGQRAKGLCKLLDRAPHFSLLRAKRTELFAQGSQFCLPPCGTTPRVILHHRAPGGVRGSLHSQGGTAHVLVLTECMFGQRVLPGPNGLSERPFSWKGAQSPVVGE